MTRETTFLTVTPALRLRIETTIENLMLLLDEIDGDADLEPAADDEDGNDAEPDVGNCTAWSNDPDVPQEGQRWHGYPA